MGWADVGPATGLQCRRWAGVSRSTLLSGECDCMYFKWHFICTYLYNVVDWTLFHWCVIQHAVIYHPAFYLEFYVYIYMYAFDVLQCVVCWNFMYSYVLCQKWRIKHVQSINLSTSYHGKHNIHWNLFNWFHNFWIAKPSLQSMVFIWYIKTQLANSMKNMSTEAKCFLKHSKNIRDTFGNF